MRLKNKQKGKIKLCQRKGGNSCMKKILLLIAIVMIGLIFISRCSKNDILDNYNKVIQSVGQIELTKKSFLQGEKSVGDDDYTGTYQADYESFSNTEYLFGGTSIKRNAGKEVKITCILKVTDGTARIFWISGSNDPEILFESSGTYEQTITLPDGRNYFGIECDKFTGTIELKIE